jgi:DNA helicase HerA-like ATPase
MTEQTVQAAQAWSFGDGRFTFVAPLAQAPTVGTPVVVSTPDGRSLLGQVGHAVLAEGPDHGVPDTSTMQVLGRGALHAVLEGGGAVTGEPFVGARVVTASPQTLRSWTQGRLGRTARLELGSVRPAGLGPAQLAADGFTRHTFLCGQSGSGKTYTLGLLIEQLLLRTDLKIIVLDPNSDYVRITEMDTEGLDPEATARAEALRDRFRVFRSSGPHPLRVRYGRLPLQQKALVLGLEPLVDAEEYDALRTVVEAMPDPEYSLRDVRTSLDPSVDSARRLALRIDNLGAADWSVWAGPDDAPIMDQLPPGWRGAVIDLGELPHPRERSAMVASVLAALWELRQQREPILLVIDEAHNVCPGSPTDHTQALAIEHAIRIAAEGRKYGLYLFLATQRPDRLHPEVLAQCENLVLMKVNSSAAIDLLAQTFSHVPRQLLDLAPTFSIGQGLVAGRIAPMPTLFASGRRRSPEGGADVPTTWAPAAAVPQPAG